MYDKKTKTDLPGAGGIRLSVRCILLAILVCAVCTGIPVQAGDAPSVTKAASAAGWVQTAKGYRYRLPDRSYVKNTFYKIGKHTYYFDAKGYRVTGWQKIGKKMYYFTVTGKMRTGWNKVKGKIYCFTSNGALRTGWYKPSNGRVFYLCKTGKAGRRGELYTGWNIISGATYYFRNEGELGEIGSMVKGGWEKIGDTEYYFSSEGICTTARMTNQEFIETVGEMAVYDMRKTGVLASLTIAQAILESGWGRSDLALEGNNLFGMKASLSGDNWGSLWKGRVHYVRGTPFRAYDSIQESVTDHSMYLLGATIDGKKKRYEGIEKATTTRQAAKILVDGGYTSGYQYVEDLVSLAKTYKLTEYDRKAREPLAG